MRLSKCDSKSYSKEFIEKLKNCFKDIEFRSSFPANFEGKSDNYADIVLVDRYHNQYPIAIRENIKSIPITIYEYDRALYHYDTNFKIKTNIESIGRTIESNIKKQAEKAITNIASKTKRKDQKIQLQKEEKFFNKFFRTEIDTLKMYVTNDILTTLNSNENLQRFTIWQVLSGIPHFNYKLPSANWLYTKNGMYDISSPDTPYIENIWKKSTILAYETKDGIKDKEEGRPFKYNNSIERLKKEEVRLFPALRFFNKVTEIRARVMQIIKRMDSNIFDALSFTSIGIKGKINL